MKTINGAEEEEEEENGRAGGLGKGGEFGAS